MLIQIRISFPISVSCKKNEASLISYAFWETVRRQVAARGSAGWV